MRSLPVTQHDRVWTAYIEFSRCEFVPSETAARIWRRFIKFTREDSEIYIEYLLQPQVARYDEAARILADIINDDKFVSKKGDFLSCFFLTTGKYFMSFIKFQKTWFSVGKSKFQLWQELCDLLCKHPDEIRSLAIEPIIRQGIRRYSDQVGLLWNALADYYIRCGLLERVRAIFIVAKYGSLRNIFFRKPGLGIA